jgi:hypothetical protein
LAKAQAVSVLRMVVSSGTPNWAHRSDAVQQVVDVIAVGVHGDAVALGDAHTLGGCEGILSSLLPLIQPVDPYRRNAHGQATA